MNTKDPFCPSRLPAIRTRQLSFAYEKGHPVIAPFSIEIDSQSRILLLGENGAGKSTLLRLFAGIHLVPAEAIEIFGESPFFGFSMASQIALVEGDFGMDIDIRVSELLDPARPPLERELLELLEIDPAWRMSRVSEGQRRRVQLLLALRREVRVLLIDEVTAHLDVLMRSSLLAWLKGRSLSQPLTIVYATHILDGLWNDPRSGWPTHLLLMAFGRTPKLLPVQDIPELWDPKPGRLSPLLAFCEDFIKASRPRDCSSRPGSPQPAGS